MRPRKGHGPQQRLDLLGRRFHKRRVKSPTDGQFDDAPSAGLGGQLPHPRHRGPLTRHYDLARRVEIGGNDNPHLGCLLAQRCDVVVVQPDHRPHRPRPRPAGFLHQPAARTHERQSLRKGEHAGRHQRRVFPETVSGYGHRL